MKKAIRIDEPKSEDKKPIEFTHCLFTGSGWDTASLSSNYDDIKKIVYLGSCSSDGDMFAVYFDGGHISIYRGHLNSGEY